MEGTPQNGQQESSESLALATHLRAGFSAPNPAEVRVRWSEVLDRFVIVLGCVIRTHTNRDKDVQPANVPQLEWLAVQIPEI